ncbi:hypothetical protein CCO02nite_05090 [Cellulomonas composti]|uniref:HNH endonuclease n=1 Tax=Cellulomonas composti TaxID=266130 RepID=A0A511J788_9CELL|nr:hypothetical protein CCO02nite_05090 [Cellulomonas composti]
MYRDQLWGVRADARAALRALDDGDLVALDELLTANRGRGDFAYHFASGATPRELGDALATVAGTSKDIPLKSGVNPATYELTLTDLAGVLALATHGTGDEALPTAWADDFVVATTNPTALYGEHDGFFDRDGKRREAQDEANRSNLLLLLSRGYWSLEFLQAVTTGYHEYDLAHDEDAWPQADPSDDVGYAPAPNGVYLNDGVLALTAALTANPAASEWAFTEFLPGTVTLDGSDQTIGRFTHYLFFEHRFPEDSDDNSIGATAALTALSSAIDAAGTSGATATAESNTSPTSPGPMHDVQVLRAMAQDVSESSGCSWNPLDYGHCVVAAAKAVWRWVQHWGHLVLDILSVATFAPPPFDMVGVAAAATNATWYAIDGDYGTAGLSLAAAVPGLAFAKTAKGAGPVKITALATKLKTTPVQASRVAQAAARWRPWKRCGRLPAGYLRLEFGKGWTPEQRTAAEAKVKALWEAGRRGQLKKTVAERDPTATARFKREGGSIPAGHDLDHVVDLQLGGSNDTANLKPLDSTVNRSIGKQIEQRLKHLELDTPIRGVAIC